jgi:hypothetical protein
MADFETTALAWTAGLIDGEGCIVIAKANRKLLKNPHYKMHVQVAMCHKLTINHLHEMFGGSITARKAKGNNRASWTWTIYNQQAFKLLKMLLPYLVTKKAEANVAIEFQQHVVETPCCGCNGLSAETLKIREAMYQECKRLKKLDWTN